MNTHDFQAILAGNFLNSAIVATFLVTGRYEMLFYPLISWAAAYVGAFTRQVWTWTPKEWLESLMDILSFVCLVVCIGTTSLALLDIFIHFGIT